MWHWFQRNCRRVLHKKIISNFFWLYQIVRNVYLFFLYQHLFFGVIVVRIATFNPKVQRWICILLHSKSLYLRNNSNSPSFFSWQKNVIFGQLPLRKPRTFNFCGGEGDLTNFLHLFQGERDLQLSQDKWAQIPWENVVAGANGLKTWFLGANGLKFLGKTFSPDNPVCP
jgi:hypothetical protein